MNLQNLLAGFAPMTTTIGSAKVDNDGKAIYAKEGYWRPRVCMNCRDVTKKSLKACGGCKMTRYCSVECQKKHWSKHKGFCSAIVSYRAAGGEITGKWYNPEEEEAKCPPNARGRIPDVKKDGKLVCPLCGRNSGQCAFMRTECCKNVVCERSDEYVMFSYSRDICVRNHDRYSKCGYHFSEEHGGDHRSCKVCFSEGNKSDDLLWRTCSTLFTFTPPLLKFYPEDRAAKCKRCKRFFLSAHEGYSGYDNDITCLACIE